MEVRKNGVRLLKNGTKLQNIGKFWKEQTTPKALFLFPFLNKRVSFIKRTRLFKILLFITVDGGINSNRGINKEEEGWWLPVLHEDIAEGAVEDGVDHVRQAQVEDQQVCDSSHSQVTFHEFYNSPPLLIGTPFK